MRMGLREANQRFSAAVKVVRAGGEVILTERGWPLAVLRPLSGTLSGEQMIRHLEAAGLLRSAARREPLPGWRPRPLRGASVTRALRQEREAS
jgi:prevent-host-death family protein